MQLTTRLTTRYIIALTIIAALLTTAYINIHQLIKTEENSAAVINTSGRQRMLTQRAALLSLRLVHANDKGETEGLRRELLHTIDLLEQSHYALRTAMISEDLEQQITQYIITVRNWVHTPDSLLSANNKDLQYILNAASGTLIQELNAVVYEKQKESERKIKAIKQFETAMFVTALLVLLAEAFYIFRPAVKTIEAEHRELQTLNEELRRLSSTDGLTGIANRRYFDLCLTQEWSRAQREQTEIALIILDVDFFKLFNDTYGHLAGDDCLKQVSQVMSVTVKRPADLVARYGGEEFAVLMPHTSLSGALSVAEQIRREVEEQEIPHSRSAVSNFVTVSLGVACMKPDAFMTPDMLITVADQALYQAKRNGRNQIADFSSLHERESGRA